MNRIATGIENLDTILQGGIPEGATIMIVGHPGAGKTILAHQMMFNNASEDFKCIYLTTLSEPQHKVLRFQQEFDYFDIEKIQSSVIYADLGSPLRTNGYRQALSVVDNLLKTHRPSLLVIDTIKTFAEIIGSLIDTREFLLDLTSRLSTWGCTTILIGDYSEEDIEIRPESAIADGIIYLSGSEERRYQQRFLRILKMRGTKYAAGENAFTISEHGIEMFTRVNPLVSTQQYPCSGARLSSGIEGLDNMMGGGIPFATTTLVSGGPGTGKTVIALNFAHTGLLAGESAIYVSFEENPAQLLRNASNLGLNLQPFIDTGIMTILFMSPIELNIDEHVYDIQQLVKKIGATRVIIDSISSFEVGMIDKIKYTDYIWSLCDYLKTQGTSILLTHESSSSQMAGLTKHGISYISDNLILIKHIEQESMYKPYLRIVKMRGSSHSHVLGEIVINNSGVTIK